MNMIEGVVAKAAYDSDKAVVTVIPLIAAPSRHLDPSRALDLTIVREEWQTDEGHRAHVANLIGRGAVFNYTSDPTPRVSGVRCT